MFTTEAVMESKMNIVREGEVRGYHEKLLLKKGTVVKIAKGTPIRRGDKVVRAAKNYMIKVNHTLPGRSICIGHYWPDTNHLGLQRMEGKYLEPFRWAYGTEKLEDLIFYAQLVEYTSTKGTKYYGLFIPIENPKVCWAGSGSYWSDVDINDVVVV